MKSRALSVATLQDCAVPPFEPAADPPSGEAELTALLRRRARTVDHDVVADGDVVRVHLEGPTPRLNRGATRIVVGMGLFDPQIERELVGAPVGVVRAIDHPEGEVAATVLESVGREVPDPTDALITELTDGRAGSVAEFRAQQVEVLRAEEFSAYVGETTLQVQRDLVERSTIEIDPADQAAVIDAEMERCRRLSAEEGLVFEEMTPQQLQARVAASSIEEFVERLQGHSAFQIGSALLAANLQGKDAADMDIRDVDQMAAALRDHVHEHISQTHPTTKEQL